MLSFIHTISIIIISIVTIFIVTIIAFVATTRLLLHQPPFSSANVQNYFSKMFPIPSLMGTSVGKLRPLKSKQQDPVHKGSYYCIQN